MERVAPSAVGAEHSLGGIAGDEAKETTDENPARVALVQTLTTAYLRTARDAGDRSWLTASAGLRETVHPLGRVVDK